MKNTLVPCIPLRRIKYPRKGGQEIDNIHMLMPLGTGLFEYALPTDSSDTVLRLVHFLFSSLDENDNFDNDNFQGLLLSLKNSDEITMQSAVKDEFIAIDFLVYTAFKAHDFINKNIREESDINIGARASSLFLGRLLSSFQSVSILIKSSMYFDASCILRSILEQVAHAYQTTTAKNVEEIKSLKSTKSISLLKNIMPESGDLYGRLSSFVHNNDKIWGEYLKIDEGQPGDTPQHYILSRSGEKTKICIIHFAQIIETYLLVLIHLYDKFCSKKIDSRSFNELITECLAQIYKLKKDINEEYFSKN
ncbi:TPA: hypothetical protein I9749_004596 [Serratia marcescens]|nr:hypothetical protein [Serratia marcescens]